MHRRIDKSGAHEVDPDSVRRQLAGSTCSQANLTMLRGDVRRAGGETEKRVYRADIDDRSALFASEQGSGLILHAEKVAFQVDAEDSVPFFLGKVHDSREVPLNAALLTA